MEWLSENWIWVVAIGGMGAMHLFGHRHSGPGGSGGGGCCGGGGHKHAKPENGAEPEDGSGSHGGGHGGGGCCGGGGHKANGGKDQAS